ncbi:type II toxin-antitoxin system RelE/ParE family toxin [Ornithobacterium rhinotracheale]|nr:type II toxin-antitoxin system RelE/ParE family toxin [Ornithobacterium rhinotracheale]MRJ10305.1 type II toxin-antitoxin system RelE/ParE family toxin [Ornithobacterium rhinotracheale]
MCLKKLKMLTIWTKTAEKDLFNLIGYIHKDSPQNAQMVLNKIEALVDSLGQMPFKYPKELIYNDDSVRYAVLYSFKIIYKVGSGEIKILRIFHTAQNPKKI